MQDTSDIYEGRSSESWQLERIENMLKHMRTSGSAGSNPNGGVPNSFIDIVVGFEAQINQIISTMMTMQRTNQEIVELLRQLVEREETKE